MTMPKKARTIDDIHDAIVQLDESFRSLHGSIETMAQRLTFALERLAKARYNDEASFIECEDCGSTLVPFGAKSCPACGSTNVFDPDHEPGDEDADDLDQDDPDEADEADKP
jgi:hypothetical protein